MKFTILNISNKMPDWVTLACNDYLLRINRGKYSCRLIEIKSIRAHNKSIAQNKADEAAKFAEHIPKGSFVIVLDERGLDLNSIKFANKISDISATNSHICVIIGGADGFDDVFRAKAHLVLKLSSLVFPHALVRIILLEQLYRSISILDNHPYHKE